MKTSPTSITLALRSHFHSSRRVCTWCACVWVLESICSADIGETGPQADEPPAGQINIPSGPILVLGTEQKAHWNYENPSGRRLRAGEMADVAFDDALRLPANSERGVDLALSVIGTAAAPIAAGVSSLEASFDKLPPEKLAQAKDGLIDAFERMSASSQLAKAICSKAKQYPVLAEHFLPYQAVHDDTLPEPALILTASVSELRLERESKRKDLFSLCIEARVQTFRTGDGAVLLDSSYTYRTPPALFLDWALNDGTPFEKCVITGYRRIASQFLGEFSQKAGLATIQLGTNSELNHKGQSRSRATIASVKHPVNAPVQFRHASFDQSANDLTYLILPREQERITFSRPLNREEASSDAIAAINEAGEVAAQHPNFIATMGGFAVLAPFGFYHQTVGQLFNGMSEPKIRSAERVLTNSIQEFHPGYDLAVNFTEELQQRNVSRVALLDAGSNYRRTVATRNGPRFLPASIRKEGTPRTGGSKIVSISVQRAGLVPSKAKNNTYEFLMQVRAEFHDAVSEKPVHTCSIQYRSAAHGYSEWAHEEAQLFKQEATHAYDEISHKTAAELIERGFITPAPSLPSIAGRN